MELIVERAELGCSMVLCQVQDLIQEILLVAIAVNPLRTSPWADDRELHTTAGRTTLSEKTQDDTESLYAPAQCQWQSCVDTRGPGQVAAAHRHQNTRCVSL